MSAFAALPAAPTASGPHPLVAIGAMVALAGLDLVGAVLARRWMGEGSWWALLLGVAAFGLLFVVYGLALSAAELSVVTLGWIVLLQVGVVAMEWSSGAPLPTGKVVAMAACLALQGYVLVAPAR